MKPRQLLQAMAVAAIAAALLTACRHEANDLNVGLSGIGVVASAAYWR